MFDNLNQPLIYLLFQLSYCDILSRLATTIHNIIARSIHYPKLTPNTLQTIIIYTVRCTHSQHLKTSTYKRWLVCPTPNTRMKAVRQCTAMDTQILRRRRSWHRCSPLFTVLCCSVVQSSHICVDAKSGCVGNRQTICRTFDQIQGNR